MKQEKTKIHLPKGSKVKTKNFAITRLNDYTSKPEISGYAKRFFTDERMISVWENVDKIFPDKFFQHVLFHAVSNTIGVWGEIELRPISDLKKEKTEVLALVRKLSSFLIREKKLIFGLDPKSLTVQRAEVMGMSLKALHGGDYDQFEQTIKNLNAIEALCVRAISENSKGRVPKELLPVPPSHDKKETAFRNFLIDEVENYLSEHLDLKNPKARHLLATLVSVVSDVDTDYDLIRKRMDYKSKKKANSDVRTNRTRKV